MNLSFHLPTTPRRVKVYELCQEEWIDNGTGYCSGELLDDKAFIIVRNEENKADILLQKVISGEIQFHKQQETLIVWSEPEKNDMALSFQEADGCSLVCDYLVYAQRHFARGISVSIITSTEEGDVSHLIAGPLEYPPCPTFDNLDQVFDSLKTLSIYQYSKESLCLYISETDYIHQLVEVFNAAENFEKLDTLHGLFRILKLLCECLSFTFALQWDFRFPLIKR